MEPVTAGCQCGQVRLVANGKPGRVGVCHCMECRKHHGAIFYAAAVFAKDHVVIEGDTHHYKGRHFCPNCGSSVFARTGDEIEIHLGSLDESNQFIPTYELWAKGREYWLPEFTLMMSYDKDRQDDDELGE